MLLQVIIDHLRLGLILLLVPVVFQGRLVALVVRLLETVSCQMIMVCISNVRACSAFVYGSGLQRYAPSDVLHRLIHNRLRNSACPGATLLLIVVQGRVDAPLLARPDNIITRIFTPAIVLGLLRL